MMKVVLAAGAVTLAAGLAGCAGSGSDVDDHDNPDVTPIEGTTYDLPQRYGKVYKVYVDGTLCVVYRGDRQGGISCDFSTEGTQ